MTWLVLSALASVPWICVRLLDVAGMHILSPVHQPYAVAALSGVAILGAAYVLSVAAEVAQLDISRSLALAFLALVAILPEYAVDMVFAWKGGGDPRAIPFATANMTGANRLLIGLFWPIVVFVFAYKHRRSAVQLAPAFRLEIFFILLATTYSFTIPLRHHISLVDFVLLSCVFVWYAVRASRAHHEEVLLEGPAARIAASGRLWRRIFVLTMFAWAALGIVLAAGPFATSLVATGKLLLSGLLGAKEAEFLMVQWVAPLASEAPELVVATIFALKALPESALGTLISSTVNQWTLLIGALPLVFSISHAWHGHGFTLTMPLDSRQSAEILLTSSQSLLACVLLVDLDLNVRDARLLVALFVAQFLVPIEAVRWGFSGVYLAVALAYLTRGDARRRAARRLVATLGRAPFSRG